MVLLIAALERSLSVIRQSREQRELSEDIVAVIRDFRSSANGPSPATQERITRLATQTINFLAENKSKTGIALVKELRDNLASTSSVG